MIRRSIISEGAVDVQDKIINTSIYSIAIMVQRELMPETGLYKTVKSNPSRMDNPSQKFL